MMQVFPVRAALTGRIFTRMTKQVYFTGLERQRERLQHDITDRLGKVMAHGQFIMGPEVVEFETALKSYCGAKHAITVANGTDALQIALMATGIGPGDGVLVPSFTYTATAEVILILGAKPIFVDVNETTFNIDMKSLEAAHAAAKKQGHNPRAIIAVDLFGLPADWSALNDFAKLHDLVLIADAAQSFGAINAHGKHVGTLAPITTASFFPAKPLGCYGDGGAIFTDDDDLAAIMKSIRVHGQGKEKYETVRVGMNSRLDTMQAAVLLSKISVFAEETKRRNQLADAYSERIANAVTVPVKPDGVISAWAQYTIRTDDRDKLQAHLKDHKVPTAIYYPKPMHLQTAYKAYGAGENSLPVSERLSRTVLSLPMNPYWDQQDLDIVCDAVCSA
jgi:UDP-2-acetamido-2-deoxy-ribo-hexuluronate aminotransferase